MQSGNCDELRRLCIAARAPGFTAAEIARLAALSPDLALLDRPDARVLASLDLTTSTREWLSMPDLARVDEDLRWLARTGVVLLPATSPRYPELLRQSPDAPAVLYVRGNVAALSEPQLAMVGSRNPTAGG